MPGSTSAPTSGKDREVPEPSALDVADTEVRSVASGFEAITCFAGDGEAPELIRKSWAPTEDEAWALLPHDGGATDA